MYDTRKEYKKAKKKVKEKKEFYSHLSVYVAMMVFFMLLNLITSRETLWFIFPMLGWGIGLLIHYFNVFGLPFVGSFDDEWEEREIQKELEKRGLQRLDDEDELELRPLDRQKRKGWDDRDFV